MSRTLSLLPDALIPPPDRGRLLDADTVARELMPPKTSGRFVRRHVYPRVMLGRRPFFYEADVRDWLETQRVEEAG